MDDATLFAYADALEDVGHRITVFANGRARNLKDVDTQQMIYDTTDIFRAAWALRKCAKQSFLEDPEVENELLSNMWLG